MPTVPTSNLPDRSVRLLLLLAALAVPACWKAPERAVWLSVPRPSTAPTPRVDVVDPPSGPAHIAVPVVLRGEDFRPGLRVFFGGAEGTVLDASDVHVTALAPPGPEGPSTVRLVNADETRAEVEAGFTRTGVSAPVPVVEGVSWALGEASGGGVFLVRGRSFASGATVTVGGQPASTPGPTHGGLIAALAPPGTPGAADIEVTNPPGASAAVPGGYLYVTLGPAEALVQGLAAFEKRQVVSTGITGSAATTPIPCADVEILCGSASPRVFSARSDRWGAFARVVDADPEVRVRVYASAAVAPAPQTVSVLDDESDRALYAVETAPFVLPAGVTARPTLAVPCEGPAGVAGAFNILAVCVHCARVTQEAVGGSLPPLRVFWEPGNAHLGGSAFTHEDTGSGPEPVIQVLGGIPGGEEFTDTDEFDDAVLSHEFGHFVQDSLSTDSSPGGSHGGERLVPNLAFSEGFASWFGCSALGDPLYRDTVGRGDWGYVEIEFSCESVSWQLPLVKGIGSEETVLEMLWDLSDGAPGAPDTDGDGLSPGFEAVLRSVAAFDPSFDYPCLTTFLDAAVARGALDAAQAEALGHAPEEQEVPYPPPPASVFPAPLAPGAPVRDFVDAREPYHPADPSWKFWLLATRGNPWNPVNGFNARRYHRFTLDETASVRLRLDIHGSGRAPEDLDLYLLDLRNAVLAQSAGTGACEIIETVLGAGTYIVEVRGFQSLGLGFVRVNAAGFSLVME